MVNRKESTSNGHVIGMTGPTANGHVATINESYTGKSSFTSAKEPFFKTFCSVANFGKNPKLRVYRIFTYTDDWLF